MGLSQRLSRRRLLRGLAVAAVVTSASACAGSTTDRAPGHKGSPRVAPGQAADDAADLALVVAAIGDEEDLLALLDQAARRRGLGSTVRPLQQIQRSHIAALRDILTTEKPSPSTSKVRLPRPSEAARRSLLRRVERARDSRRGDCLAAHAGLLGRLLASMSASHAVTSTTLGAS